MTSTNQNFFNIIETILEKRNAKIKIYTYPFNSMMVDMPKREKFVHGSSFEIECDKPQTNCNIRGDFPIESRLENIESSEFEKLDCKIKSIHRWKPTIEFPIKESHIHFTCNNKNQVDIIKIINKLKNH